ncbi:MAG: branched-chain amino acid ABC transporter permease, partial [Alphaproteobacteria bacterium]
MTDLAASAALPKPQRDLLPVLLPAIVALLMLPLVGSG